MFFWNILFLIPDFHFRNKIHFRKFKSVLQVQKGWVLEEFAFKL